MTAHSEALRRLSKACGIETGYVDIWGNHHQVSEKSQKAFLRAMGSPVETASDIDAALASIERRRWRNPLPPVRVARESEVPVPVPLSLPESCSHATLRWTLTDEQGRSRGGEARAASLPVLERKTLEDGAYVSRLLHLEPAGGPGYYRLRLDCGAPGLGREVTMSLIVAPAACYQPPVLAGGGRVWGPAVQLYALRSARNWGIGDFTDLENLIEWCSELGAGIVGLNPLHALFPHNPGLVSPYSPSSRLFRNTLYLDVEAFPEFGECEEAKGALGSPEMVAALGDARASDDVRYTGVGAAKSRIFELLYAHFKRAHLETASDRGAAFRAYQARGGETLQGYALFLALQEHFHREDARVWGWPAWPEPFRDPASPEVAAFAQTHRDRIEFHLYLQWEVERQYGNAARRSLELNLGVGLYEDLALGVDRGGADAWANQWLYAAGVSIGCPPDDSNPHGQNWGLPPMAPAALAESAHGPFISLLRHTMRNAGAIRLDHIMGLMRLFWIPSGCGAEEGAYVNYPFEDLLGILALESRRNRCLVVGEDLGTVPDAVRAAMRDYGIFSYRVFYYEKYWEENRQKPPADYPENALVTVGTHDLPTLPGFWTGRDIALRTALDFFPTEAPRERQWKARADDRSAILEALRKEGLLPCGVSPDPASPGEIPEGLIEAVYRFLARSRGKVMLVQFEDLLGETGQINMPGTVDEYPNWRHKLAATLEDLRRNRPVREICAAIGRERAGGAGERNP